MPMHTRWTRIVRFYAFFFPQKGSEYYWAKKQPKTPPQNLTNLSQLALLYNEKMGNRRLQEQWEGENGWWAER